MTLRILIVDDTVDSADMLGTLVKMFGHDARVVYSGQEALDSVRTQTPDVVFLDIGLPDIDGYELAGRLRALPELARAHMIAITGYGSDDDKQRGREVGIDLHLVKPIDPSRIERLLQELSR